MEKQFHNWLRHQIEPRNSQSVLGIGDDGAIISSGDDDFVVSTDTIADTTHFDLEKHSLTLIGRKSLAVNLSDIAAMGATPVSAVLTFLLPKSFQISDAKELFKGIEQLAKEYSVDIVGGDTNSWNGPLVVGATVFGIRAREQAGWSIGGAKAGDQIVASGSFGGSIHGRHFSFCPRVKLAEYMAKHYVVNGATDASDSLSLDLNSMVDASGVGANLNLPAIPVSSDVLEIKESSRLERALTDGEDFELILAIPRDEVDRIQNDQNICDELTVIGEFTDEHSEVRGIDSTGQVSKIIPHGYVH